MPVLHMHPPDWCGSFTRNHPRCNPPSPNHVRPFPPSIYPTRRDRPCMGHYIRSRRWKEDGGRADRIAGSATLQLRMWCRYKILHQIPTHVHQIRNTQQGWRRIQRYAMHHDGRCDSLPSRFRESTLRLRRTQQDRLWPAVWLAGVNRCRHRRCGRSRGTGDRE